MSIQLRIAQPGQAAPGRSQEDCGKRVGTTLIPPPPKGLISQAGPVRQAGASVETGVLLQGTGQRLECVDYGFLPPPPPGQPRWGLAHTSALARYSMVVLFIGVYGPSARTVLLPPEAVFRKPSGPCAAPV